MAAAVSAALKKYDMVVDHVLTIAQATEAASPNVHGAVLLDRRLPDGDGLTLIPILRAKGVAAPIIVLTAYGELADRIEGLDTGADDYLAKPFAIEELMARLRAVLRRPAPLLSPVVRVGRLSFNLNHREAVVDGQALDLPRRELLVLEALVSRLGRTVLRSALEAAVYSLGDDIRSNALDAHISRLRRKLAQADAGVEIHGIRGVGYLLKQSAFAVPASASAQSATADKPADKSADEPAGNS
jgi:DNA-binding response OmpR family regulator